MKAQIVAPLLKVGEIAISFLLPDTEYETLCVFVG